MKTINAILAFFRPSPRCPLCADEGQPVCGCTIPAPNAMQHKCTRRESHYGEHAACSHTVHPMRRWAAVVALVMVAAVGSAGPLISWDRPDTMNGEPYFSPIEPFEYVAYWQTGTTFNASSANVTNIPATTATTNIGYRMPGGKAGWYTFAVAARWGGFTNFGAMAVITVQLDGGWFKIGSVKSIKIAP